MREYIILVPIAFLLTLGAYMANSKRLGRDG